MKSIFGVVLLFNAAFARAEDYPINVRGGDDRSFVQKAASGELQVGAARYDVIVIGGGLAGLTASVFLSGAGKKVLLLEKEKSLGGLAAGGTLPSGAAYGRGAAYWAEPSGEGEKIFAQLGFNGREKKNAIPEPIDSYLWNGKLYSGLWDKKTVTELPASFAVFKHELVKADEDGLIPEQPFEDGKLDLDKMSGAEWIRSMPAALARRTDGVSKKVLARFQSDARVPKTDPMSDVVALLDLYCRSALGTECDRVSAAALANFYISEIDTRYSSTTGTGHIAKALEKIIKSRRDRVTVRTEAMVTGIFTRQDPNRDVRGLSSEDGVEVRFASNGALHSARGAYAVYAAQMKFAPKLIDGLDRLDAEKAAAIERMNYAHYSVHVVTVKGHPFRASYDTWIRNADYSPLDPTDVILGRWMDPAIQGYKGLRDFKKDPKDADGVFTLYVPHVHGADTLKNQTLSRHDHMTQLARASVERLRSTFTPILKKGHTIQVKSVETSMWPFSMHIVKPGYFTREAPVLRRPAGRIMFAHNNVGTPAIEEAIYRGHCAANNVLKRLDPKFKNEPWTKCRLE